MVITVNKPLRTTSLCQLEREYFDICNDVSSYRLGQHFINCCIKSGSGDEDKLFFSRLWNENDVDKAREMLYSLITRYQWDVDNLVVWDK